MNRTSSRRSRRHAVWLVAAALLLGALAPTVSRGLHAGRSDPAASDLCTSQGPRRPAAGAAGVAAAGEPLPGRSGALPVLDHCPLCMLAAERLGPPPATQTALRQPARALGRPAARAPRRRSAVPAAALARGPPRLATVS